VGEFHGVAGVAETLEVNTLDDAPGVHVEAGNDAYGYCHGNSWNSVVRE
jgi:hypothetical protein